MKFRFVLSVLAILSLCRMDVIAQTGSTADNPTLQSLLFEVRQLRVALERASSLLSQTQLLLQRAQLQQQHVESVSRQLEQLREQMTKSSAQDAYAAASLKDLEAHISQEQDPKRRRELEEEIKGLKRHLDLQGISDQEQKA